jgi:hypothetical protein
MARPRDIPEGAEIIHTYMEFQWYLKAFADGHLTLLIVVGRPGLSKSASIKNALADSPVCLIQGHVRPIQAYIELFRHRNQLVVLDDAQGLEDPAGRNLLTSLAQTDRVKNLEWLSSSRILSDLKVPDPVLDGQPSLHHHEPMVGELQGNRGPGRPWPPCLLRPHSRRGPHASRELAAVQRAGCIRFHR